MDGMNRSLEESSQYQVASYLDEKKEPVTLMYYNTLDTGALMFSDYARPWGKYYFMPNISHKNFPDLLDTQEAGIRNREADYVLSYRVFPEVLHKYYRLVQYFPQDMETNTGAYYLMEANPYVLCGDCTLEFHDDSSLANVSGELEWVMQGDEAAIELIGTLPQPIKAAHISLIVPPEVSPDIFLLVSADGENWFQPPSQLDDQEISIELNAMEIQYIKLVRDRNLGIHSLWKLWVYKTEEN